MSRRIATRLCFALLVLTGGCDSEDPGGMGNADSGDTDGDTDDNSGGGDTDEWVGGEIPDDGNGGLPPGDTADSEGPDEGGDGDEDGDEEPESFAIWSGELERANDVLGDGFLEFFALEVDEQGAELEACTVFMTLTLVSEPQGCGGCQFAAEAEISEVEVETDVGCANYGIDPASLGGTRIAVGYGGGEELYVRDGEEWIAHGFAELHPDSFFFEWAPL